VLHLNVDLGLEVVQSVVCELKSVLHFGGLQLQEAGVAQRADVNGLADVYPVGVDEHLQLEQRNGRILALHVVSLVVWLVGESQVEGLVPRFVAQTHEVLPLTGSLVARSVLVSAVLRSATLVLPANIYIISK